MRKVISLNQEWIFCKEGVKITPPFLFTFHKITGF